MSEKIKLKLKPDSVKNGLGVKVKDISSEEMEAERAEDFYQTQLQKQFELGYSKGYDSAIDELEKSYSEKLLARLKDVHGIATSLEQSIMDHEEYYESILLQLSLIIAEKIIKREVAQKTIIDDVVRESLKRIIGANNVVVKLNPLDLSELSSESKELMNDSAFNKIKFEADERIELFC